MGEGGRGPAGVRGLRLVLFVWVFPPLLCRCGHSVPQDDFHKAGHVGFFGLVGGEEGMLLRRRTTLEVMVSVRPLVSD